MLNDKTNNHKYKKYVQAPTLELGRTLFFLIFFSTFNAELSQDIPYLLICDNSSRNQRQT